MSVSALTIPNVSQENTVEDITEEERSSIYNYLRVLDDHLSSCGISPTVAIADGSAGKLAKLTVRHLMELASDMCDELDRRDIGSSSPLASKSELTSKRNNARMRMAEFTSEKLNNLILDVFQEIDRRKISPPSINKPVEIEEAPKKKRVVPSEDSSRKFEQATKKNKSLTNEASKIQIQEQDQSLPAPKMNSSATFNSTSFSSGLGIDSLDAMIEDLGSLIENDGHDGFDELKQKYEAEIQSLKQVINKYEHIIIAEKNTEISRLMTKVEETELINTRLRKELSSLNEQLLIRDGIIQDQKLAYEILNESLDKIQNQISNRVFDAIEASRAAARCELVSSNVFSDLRVQNEQINSTVNGLEECISNFNQKLFLKFLRDIATSAKAFILLFDRLLQASQSLEFDDLCRDGDKLKSEYISALSSLLVSGKDFCSRPQYCSEFKSNVESFKFSNESLFDFKIKLESTLQSN